MEEEQVSVKRELENQNQANVGISETKRTKERRRRGEENMESGIQYRVERDTVDSFDRQAKGSAHIRGTCSTLIARSKMPQLICGLVTAPTYTDSIVHGVLVAFPMELWRQSFQDTTVPDSNRLEESRSQDIHKTRHRSKADGLDVICFLPTPNLIPCCSFAKSIASSAI